MPSKLSNLVDNLPEINNKDCRTCIESKNIKSECEFIGLKNNRLKYRCKECNGTSTESVNDLIEKFPRMHKFCSGNHNKFVMLLRKGVYPYEYMDSWERFNETYLPPKKDFYNELTLEDITDKDYEHAQKMFNEYCTNMGDYHDLYGQTDTLLLSDVFEKFREKCIEIYGLGPSYFYSAPGLAWQACFKKTKVKLPVNGFMWYNSNLSDFNEEFIKSYDEKSDEGHFLEADIEYPKTLLGSHKELPFLPERRKLEKLEKLVCSIEDKKNMSYT